MKSMQEYGHQLAAPPVALASIVVALDGSVDAEAGLNAAVELARRTNATLHLVRAVVPMPERELPQADDWEYIERHDALRHLEHEAKLIRSRTGIAPMLHLEDGPAAEALTTVAERVHADLIVMTTHGRTDVTRAMLGSVADAVTRHTNSPLLLLRGPRAPNTPVAKILVGLDGSAGAEAVLHPAVQLAIACAARLELLQVVKPVLMPVVNVPMGPPVLMADPELTRQQAELADGYLESVAARLEEAGVGKVAHRALVAESASRAILEEADETGADTIALASHGRGASRLVFGSVADTVLHDVTKALLLVRVPGTA